MRLAGRHFACCGTFSPYLKGAHEPVIHAHHGTRVVKLSAVVWRRKERHQPAFREKLVTVLHHLFRFKEALRSTGVGKGKGKGYPLSMFVGKKAAEPSRAAHNNNVHVPQSLVTTLPSRAQPAAAPAR